MTDPGARELRASVAAGDAGWLLRLAVNDPVTEISPRVTWALRATTRDDVHLEALRLLRGWASLVEVAWKAPPPGAADGETEEERG